VNSGVCIGVRASQRWDWEKGEDMREKRMAQGSASLGETGFLAANQIAGAPGQSDSSGLLTNQITAVVSSEYL
jgi:hypothetical protein